MTSNSSARPQVDCIYCCKLGPFSREHVLAASLGGNLKAPVACDECNTGFSKIDQALAENSVVALERILQTPSERPVRLGNLHFMHRPEDDLWEEVQITNKLRPHIPPQLHYRRPKTWFFASRNEDRARFVAEVNALVSSGNLGSLSIVPGPEQVCSTARLVRHRRRTMFVRARTKDDGEAFVRDLPALWGAVEPGVRNDLPIVRTDDPTINMVLSMSLDDCYRAIAKTAFNYLAVQKGIAFARLPVFDPVRQYIRGLDIRHPTTGSAVDRRFVREEKKGEFFLIPTTQHLITLGYSSPHVFAAITLYGKHTFLVQLGDIHIQSLPDFEPIAHEFSIDGSQNRELGVFEMVRRMRYEEDEPPATRRR
ncbi:MAG: HNH endonuclease [Kofleriaceae bacterium]